MKRLLAALLLFGLFASTANAASVISLFGPIDDEKGMTVAGQIIQADQAVDQEPILLLINSPGGSLAAGKVIADAIILSKHPVNTMCVGQCSSMAAMLFEMGKIRYMWPHAVLMFHEASVEMECNPAKCKSRMAKVEADVAYFEMMIAKRVGLSYDAYRSAVKDEVYISATNFGNWADEVVTTTALPVK